MKFLYPPTIATGQILSKVQLDTYRLNDEFFNGVADAWRPVAYGIDRGFIGDELELLVYDGFHLLRSDAKTLVYYIWVNGGGDGRTVTLRLYYDGVQAASVSTTGGLQISSGTYSLSAKSPGLYRVHALLQRNQTGGGTGGLRAPFTRYTGARSYTTPPTITDGNTSSATHFNTWRDNDLYFYDVMHPNPGFTGLKGGWTADETSRELWRGYARWNPEQYRVYYSLWNKTTAGNNRLRLYFDRGGAYEQYINLNGSDWQTGYWDLSNPGNYTRGNYYAVTVQQLRDTTADSKGEVGYIYLAAPAKDTDYTVMGEHTAGQYVYGSTAGQSTRLALLSANDGAIRDRLIFADGTTGRQDYAVAEPEFIRLGTTDRGSFAITRRFDLLYYRTKSARLVWEDVSHGLTDYDDPDDPYFIVNLNSVGIPRGVVYKVEGTELAFAMEI